MQMCQYHQIQIVRRYLTNKSELPAAIEVLNLVKNLTVMDKESFFGAYNQWNDKWKEFSKESRMDNGKKIHIHKRLRSANHGLKMNMQHLWTWYNNMELSIPNTNNTLEGYFSHLKGYLNNHSGLRYWNRRMSIDKYITKEYE